MVVLGCLATVAAASDVDQAVTDPVVGPVVAAVGDAVCAPGGAVTATTCRQNAVSDLVVHNSSVVALLALGDLQYETGALSAFRSQYDPSFGRVRAITRPAPGNHEYATPNARGYFKYFGTLAGDPAKGYTSFDIGTWHVVQLNSNCTIVACDAQSEQLRWLRADLAAHPAACTLAYWHHPRFSSGAEHGDDHHVAAFWQALGAAGADVVLNGHEHVYERFAPQLPDRSPSTQGMRQFTVGTGGKVLTAFAAAKRNSEVRAAGDFGVLELTLGDGAYSWQFVSVKNAVLDEGITACH